MSFYKRLFPFTLTLILAICPAMADEFDLFDEEISEKISPSTPLRGEQSSPPELPLEKSQEPPFQKTDALPSGISKSENIQNIQNSKVQTAKDLKLKIEKLKKEIRSDPKNYEKIVDLSYLLYEVSEIEKVKKLLWKYIDKIPSRGHHLLEKVHEEENLHEKVLKVCEIALSKNSKDSHSFAKSGEVYFKLKKDKEAIEAFKNAIDLNPKFEGAYWPLIEYYEKKRNSYENRILLRDMLRSIGAKPKILLTLCQLNIDDKTFEQGKRDCELATQKDPETPENYTNLALSYIYSDQIEKGEKLLKSTAEKNKKAEYSLKQYADYLFEQKNYVDSVQYYAWASEIPSASGKTWVGLGKVQFELYRYSESLIAFEKACIADKSTLPAFRKATITLRNKKNKEWADPFEKASDRCALSQQP